MIAPSFRVPVKTAAMVTDDVQALAHQRRYSDRPLPPYAYIPGQHRVRVEGKIIVYQKDTRGIPLSHTARGTTPKSIAMASIS